MAFIKSFTLQITVLYFESQTSRIVLSWCCSVVLILKVLDFSYFLRFEPGTFRSWSRWDTNVPPCFPFLVLFHLFGNFLVPSDLPQVRVQARVPEVRNLWSMCLNCGFVYQQRRAKFFSVQKSYHLSQNDLSKAYSMKLNFSWKDLANWKTSLFWLKLFFLWSNFVNYKKSFLDTLQHYIGPIINLISVCLRRLIWGTFSTRESTIA